jgi:hypothetical protein
MAPETIPIDIPHHFLYLSRKCEEDKEKNMKDHNRIARKITIVLFLSQSLSSAGFIAAFTVNALVGVDLGRLSAPWSGASAWSGSAGEGVSPWARSSG